MRLKAFGARKGGDGGREFGKRFGVELLDGDDLNVVGSR
jgi:hypothetical protein